MVPPILTKGLAATGAPFTTLNSHGIIFEGKKNSNINNKEDFVMELGWCETPQVRIARRILAFEWLHAALGQGCRGKKSRC